MRIAIYGRVSTSHQVEHQTRLLSGSGVVDVSGAAGGYLV